MQHALRAAWSRATRSARGRGGLAATRSGGRARPAQRSGAAQVPAATRGLMADAGKSSGFEVRKSEEEWRAELRPQEYHVLREKGTERAYTGEYDKFYPAADEGYFACRACKNPLYTAAAKFDSGCGWPAFDKCIKDSMVVEVDNSFGMKRVEIMCAKCGGHLGHVFHGEGLTPTNERHCVNSVSVKFMKGPVPSSSEEQDGEENDGETASGPAEEVLKDSKM